MGSKDNIDQTSDLSLVDAQKQWQAALGELQLQMTRATFDTWLRGSRVMACERSAGCERAAGFEEAAGCEGRTFTILVRHAYAVDWLQNRLLPTIKRTLRRYAGPDVEVVFTARAQDPEENLVLVAETVHQAHDAARSSDPAPAHHNGTGGGVRTNGRPSTTLNRRYTFSSFVVGASNRLAHAACLAVAENPAHAYNPLFLYGGVGLGKTHLLHALGHAAQQENLSALYVSSEWFTNDLINAIRSQKTEEFRGKYRNIDVLLVDDIQFIAGKERTQEEFFHTFNTLHDAGKQIVVSCDRPPKALVALEDRLRSRFAWGLIADVQPPDFETRIAILRAKAESTLGYSASVQVPGEILTYIARKIPSNIRELEGALNRVLAHARLMQAPLTLDTAQAALDSILAHSSDLSPEKILSTVAEHYNLSQEQLVGRSRVRAVSTPRQLVMYLIREETGTSLPQIGQLLGGRDHTTIMHGCDRMSVQIETDEQLRRDWLTIKQMLSEGTASR